MFNYLRFLRTKWWCWWRHNLSLWKKDTERV